jgi:hypothetical protein
MRPHSRPDEVVPIVPRLVIHIHIRMNNRGQRIVIIMEDTVPLRLILRAAYHHEEILSRTAYYRGEITESCLLSWRNYYRELHIMDLTSRAAHYRGEIYCQSCIHHGEILLKPAYPRRLLSRAAYYFGEIYYRELHIIMEIIIENSLLSRKDYYRKLHLLLLSRALNIKRSCILLLFERAAYRLLSSKLILFFERYITESCNYYIYILPEKPNTIRDADIIKSCTQYKTPLSSRTTYNSRPRTVHENNTLRREPDQQPCRLELSIVKTAISASDITTTVSTIVHEESDRRLSDYVQWPMMTFD